MEIEYITEIHIHISMKLQYLKFFGDYKENV